MAKAGSTEKVVREIRQHTRRRFSAEEKIRIVLEGSAGKKHRGALPPRRLGTESLLPMEQGIPRGWQKAVTGRYAARSDIDGSPGPAPREQPAQAGRGRCGPRVYVVKPIRTTEAVSQEKLPAVVPGVLRFSLRRTANVRCLICSRRARIAGRRP